MLKNYLKIAIRNITRQKLKNVLNITGLALGIACSLLIFLHVKEELSYDKFFPKSDRIYRITNEGLTGDVRHWAVVSPLHGLEIQADIPEIEETTRLFYLYTIIMSYTPVDGEPKRFEEDKGYYSDPATISMFNLDFLKGDPNKALNEVNTIVLTRSMAQRYFGDADPIGKAISDDSARKHYRITGVIEDFPFNTHMQIDFLVSMETFYRSMIERKAEEWLTARGWAHFYTYVLINQANTIEQAEAKMPDFTANFYKEWGTREEILAGTKLHFQPLTDIHLHSNLEQEMGPNSNIIYVYIFTAIALFILVIAGVNFVNISTAQAFKRMREVGVRKVMGAYKLQLIRQFLGEAFILTLVAAIFSLVIFQLAIPFYNSLSGKSLNFLQIFAPENLALFIGMIVLLSLLAGIYPALFLANFQPAMSLKSMRDPKSSVTLVRKGLVVFQFIISIFMIFCTLTIYQQMKFINSKDLGFNKDRIIAITLYGNLQRSVLSNASALKTELLQFSGISHVSMASNLPGERFSVENLRPEGTSDEDRLPSMRYLRVDEDFLDTMQITLAAGNNFRKTTRYTPAFIINEAAATGLNLENPVGTIATNFRGVRGEIVGVAKDFSFASLHNKVEPLVLEYRPSWAGHLLVKVQAGRIPDAVRFLETKVREMAPGHLFMYTFVDDFLNRLYISEARVSDIFKAFSLLAIFISCLGLFGLSAYAVELRIKEIGVRKVLGASIPSVVTLLSKEFALWVLFANIIAWPLAYFAMDSWLKNFAFRINIGIVVFFASALLALLIALLTVSYQSIKAAIANPVDSLRYE